MQPLTASNQDQAWSVATRHGVVIDWRCRNKGPGHRAPDNKRILPMIDSKKTSELIETSLIYLLSAAVAVGAFVLVWLISLVLGVGQA
jgi:hypothetical protein